MQSMEYVVRIGVALWLTSCLLVQVRMGQRVQWPYFSAEQGFPQPLLSAADTVAHKRAASAGIPTEKSEEQGIRFLKRPSMALGVHPSVFRVARRTPAANNQNIYWSVNFPINLMTS